MSERRVRDSMRIFNRSPWAIAVGAALYALCGASFGGESDSGVRSIAGSGLRSIAGSGVRSIAGSGVRSIAGSGVRSIAGSGVSSILGSSVLSIASSSRTNASADGADSADIVVFGGLESAGQGRINVMGQEFDASGLGLQAMDLKPGRLVYVEAKKGDELPVATSVHAFDDLAIPGATAVFVRGSVDSVDAGLGQALVGNLRIDLNSIGGDAPTVGDLLSISGTQPLPSGLILGDARF